MSSELAIVLALLVAAIAMFAINKPRMDVVALIMLTALPLTGVIDVSEALAGFSDPNIVLIAALFVIGDGLVRTGVARSLGDWLTVKAGSNETKLLALLMAVVCGLGSMMSSTAVTAIFIPVALRISQSTGTPSSRLMMPLSMAALTSGMMTLIATAPNLVVSSELERNGFEGLHFFAFTPFGIPVLVLAIAYMMFARRWLGGHEEVATDYTGVPTLANWVEEYNLVAREHRVQVTDQSPFIGETVESIRLQDTSGAKMIAIQRGKALIHPSPKTQIQSGDILLVDLIAEESAVEALRQKFGLEALPLTGDYFTDRSQEIGMAEVILPANSKLIGNSLVETSFYDQYGVRVIGVRRGLTTIEYDLKNEDLQIGDTLLVLGPWREIRNLQSYGNDLVVFNLPAEMKDELPAHGRASQAIFSLALVIGLMVSGVVPNVLAALIGCLLMGALRCVDMNSAYRSIDWKTLVLIVGMLPFSIALQRTGGVDLVADGLMKVIGQAGTYMVLGVLFAITAMLGMFISNTATAVLMAPVAIALAKDLGASPYPFAMIVALAASSAFMTPVSSPVNTLVVTPGNYTFGDFVKIGVPFTIIVMIVCVVMVPWLLPL
ncbi:SLC13 family permease [Bythopirellula polymerisocia]|uniref:Potassium transporter peripheral membrane component n=1 Tax=Bythopirellula polymerisocia TaxID=2528003 RepID=A0A5C6D254_9BACT|nr:SLC13 family permease [Bythopirellula polymerisocia]TWU29737.1 potassium transporter peripheral membrane component [Bythopirellula polymerisocia]